MPCSEHGIIARRHPSRCLYKITIFEKHLFIIVLLFGACGHDSLRKVCRLLGWPWGTVAAIIYSAPQVLQLENKFIPRVFMSASMHGEALGALCNTRVSFTLRSHEQSHGQFTH